MNKKFIALLSAGMGLVALCAAFFLLSKRTKDAEEIVFDLMRRSIPDSAVSEETLHEIAQLILDQIGDAPLDKESIVNLAYEFIWHDTTKE